MSDARLALLPDRGVVSVTGEDARKLLQGLITNDMDVLDGQPAIHAGLLSPQGKLLFEFLVIRDEGGYLLDVARDKAGELVKRLTMYRLRAKAQIRDASGELRIWAGWNEPPVGGYGAALAYPDPRLSGLGIRLAMGAADLPQRAEDGIGAADYHAHRIALGIPEGGKDWDFGDAFPHEANLDLHNGVSFEKGCYVGQEIVSRMQHRGTVRKRVVRVTAVADLPVDRPDVTMGEVVIGRLGSVAGRQGLAMLRLDRAIEAIDKGTSVTAAGIALDVDPDMIARQRKLMADKAAG
jgi:folate-binding protein YgfZ